MSERFPDDVLHQAVMAYASTKSVDAAFAAMRAVLDAHLAEQETEHPTVTCDCPHAPDCPLGLGPS